jgi:hypothetical protein
LPERLTGKRSPLKLRSCWDRRTAIEAIEAIEAIKAVEAVEAVEAVAAFKASNASKAFKAFLKIVAKTSAKKGPEKVYMVPHLCIKIQ